MMVASRSRKQGSGVNIAWIVALVLLGSFILIRIGCSYTRDDTLPVDSLRYNQIQVLGSHNSYKMAMDNDLMKLMRQQSPELSDSLDYAHIPLDSQLDLGLRNLELDVIYDPEGGRYASPFGVRAIESAAEYDPHGEMDKPGFKVLHVQDIDFRSHCLTFIQCLTQIEAWSQRHPAHLPILIMLNAKYDVIEQPNFVQPLPYDARAWDSLESEISSVMKDKVVTPAEVRGEHPTLEAAVLAHDWPIIGTLRGRFIFLLDESGEKRDGYLQDRDSPLLFVDVPEGHPQAGFRVVNDPVENFNYITQLVRKGYVVRTRADADTLEARMGDTRRREAAFSSGAQIVTTDYYLEDSRFGTAYSVSLPVEGIARCNPVAHQKNCSIEE